jgi:EAL and modified HD-GYP domain-containing signal transduction protein
MNPTTATTDVLLARQPIYDEALRVVAYELLAQRPDGSPAAEEADAASITELGLNLVMGQPAYIPLSRAFLLQGHANALPSDRVVLQVGPELLLDRAALDGLQELARSGYRLALVDFESGGPLEELLPLASVVALDVQALDRGPLRSEMAALRFRPVQLLARGVEDHEQLALAQELDFDLFHGYFFCRPRVLRESGVHVNRLNRIRLLAALQHAELDIDAVQTAISHDVALSYNLLRFINSAFFSLPRRVESIRDAVVLLGTSNVRKWATLMALAEVDDKPHELVVTGLVRARFCELLAQACGYEDSDGFFTAGLFSVVDALMDASLVELLAQLPLSSEIIEALLNHEGRKGRVLHAVIAYERGKFGELGNLPPMRQPLSDLYGQAVGWATDASGVMAAA